MKTFSLVCATVAFWHSANAIHLELYGKRQPPGDSSLRKRATITGTSGLTDSLDIQYSTNITLGGLPFSVLIDTGSSDLWVASANAVPGAVDTGATSGVQYAVGEVQGPIELGALEFAGYTVHNQAFLFVTPDPNSNPDGTGLIGLGPSSGSNIFQTLSSASGNPPLDNIFLQNMSTPNYLTILLNRANDPDDPFPGDLTVGEILPGYDPVLQQPQVPVSVASITNTGDQHWQVLLDKNGVIANGQPVPITSVVSNTNQATVVFDSGFSLPQVPKPISDAFYSSFTGAEFINITGLGGVWILPCASEVNISFQFSGQTYPVHPLDATLEPQALGLQTLQNSEGTDACIGAFQPVSFDAQGLFDMILGMAFLRNVYLLINFGDFVQGTTNKAAPYVQLLSTTNNSAQAHADFIAVRVNNSTSGPNTFNPTNNHVNGGGGGSPSFNRNVYYIAAAVAAGIIVLISVWILRRRRRNWQRGASTAAWGSYAPLSAPAPAAAMEMQMQPPPPSWNQPYSGGYNPQPSHPPYTEPWNTRY